MSEEFYIVRTHKVRETPAYSFEIEEHQNDSGDQFCMAHIEVWHFTPSIFKRMLREWAHLRTIITCPLYVTAPVQDEKWMKFVEAFGFRPLRPVITNGGAERTLFVSTAG